MLLCHGECNYYIHVYVYKIHFSFCGWSCDRSVHSHHSDSYFMLTVYVHTQHTKPTHPHTPYSLDWTILWGGHWWLLYSLLLWRCPVFWCSSTRHRCYVWTLPYWVLWRWCQMLRQEAHSKYTVQLKSMVRLVAHLATHIERTRLWHPCHKVVQPSWHHVLTTLWPACMNLATTLLQGSGKVRTRL